MSNFLSLLGTWFELPKYYTDFYYHYLVSFRRLIDQTDVYMGQDVSMSIINLLVKPSEDIVIWFTMYLFLQGIRAMIQEGFSGVITVVFLKCAMFAPYFYFYKRVFDTGIFGMIFWPLLLLALLPFCISKNEAAIKKFWSPPFLILGLVFGVLALKMNLIWAGFLGHGLAIILAIIAFFLAKSNKLATLAGGIFAFLMGYTILYGIDVLMVILLGLLCFAARMVGGFLGALNLSFLANNKRNQASTNFDEEEDTEEMSFLWKIIVFYTRF